MEQKLSKIHTLIFIILFTYLVCFLLMAIAQKRANKILYIKNKLYKDF